MSDLQHRLKEDARAASHAAHQSVEQLRAKATELRRRFQSANFKNAPYFQNIGANYEATFSQNKLQSKRVVLTTPNLWTCNQSGTEIGKLFLSSVHSSTPNGQANDDEQITANLDWKDIFGPTDSSKSSGSPLGVDFQWNRPIEFNVTSYAAIPVHNASAAEALYKLGFDVMDVNSGYIFGFAGRYSESQRLHTLKSRGGYGTVTVDFRSLPKQNLSKEVSASVASTLYREVDTDTSLHAGICVDSNRFSAEDSGPSGIAAITGRAEWNANRYVIDSAVKASAYSKPSGSGQTFKVSEALVRGMYLPRLGMFPRWCVGMAVGMVDNGGDNRSASGSDKGGFHPYGDPDEVPSWRDAFGAQLNHRFASISYYYQHSPYSQLKARLSSAKELTITQSFQLHNNVHVSACLNTLFPEMKLNSISLSNISATAQMSLGFGVEIRAD